MLYLLTGNIQTGKTRWLQDTIERLGADGIVCHGVLAPGDWVPSDGPRADGNGFEKLGIWNELLPEGERIRFAERRDIAEAGDAYDRQSQAGNAGMGWHISDAAIHRVNEHLASIPARVEASDDPAFLVIDELGPLELKRGAGLTEGVSLLEQGPQGAMQDALIVVREELVSLVEERFGGKWHGSKRIVPGDVVRIDGSK